MASSEALLGTSSGDGVLAVADGSCKVTTAEVVARPVCQQEESLEFLSLDQVETVSLSLNPLGPLIEKFGHPSSTETGSWIPIYQTRVPTLTP